MEREVVGRDQELASVAAFIGGVEAGAAALVLEGQAGIGKSTLWLAGVERARELGLRVLSSRPAEPERRMAHVGLGDLLDGVLVEVLHVLPPPRRRALEVALLLEEAPADSIDPRALGVAVRSCLEHLAEDGPLLVAIDDVQWFDAASAGALGFAFRRLAASHVSLLVARRLGMAAQPPEIEQSFGHDIQRLAVGPLSVGALQRLLHDRLDRAFARQTLLRIHERSGGNPFFALEIARALPDEVDPLQPLPVPETLEELVRGRLAGLPAGTREALALASALGTPTEPLLERAGVQREALDPAIDAQVIERDGGTIRFTHPLLASILYKGLREKRRGVHARLAGIVEEPLQHARHLALSTEFPDAQVAGALDRAARIADERGALAIAAELSDHALRLTPSDERENGHRRALAASRAHDAAGEWTRARKIAVGLLAETEAGPRRADVLVLLAEFEIDALAVPLLDEALREAAGHPALCSRVHLRLAWATRFIKGYASALKDARAALVLADDTDDDRLKIEVLDTLSWVAFLVGDTEAESFGERARQLALAAGHKDMAYHEPNVTLAQMLIESGRLGEARELLERDYEHLSERDELRLSNVLWNLAMVELWSGRWELAEDHAQRGREINAQYGRESHHEYIPVAWIAVHRGQLERAQELAERALELCEQQIGHRGPLFTAVPGLVALWSGDARTAVHWLADADRDAAAIDWGEPGRRWWTADYVEALLELGRIDDAVRVLDLYEADAVRLGRDRVLAQVTRCRGLVAAAEGNIDDATRLLEQAVGQHGDVGDPFGRARASLALGTARRRTRQKRAARDAIEKALSGFEQLGAPTWIQKAHGELGRIGGRTREDGLTAAERRVAALVAEGRTNKEVAAALFVGQRTVETHLSHVYAKLGIRSRAELARTFRMTEQSSGGLTISS